MSTLFLWKKEVASWPLIGYLCKISGVVFVDRKCQDSRQKNQRKHKGIINSGNSVINFPEGTTDTLTTVNFSTDRLKLLLK
jgi:1-acyl-sn-glycerol-3-phosphate acyltransferase